MKQYAELSGKPDTTVRWWQLSIEETCQTLRTSPTEGLVSAAIAERRAASGRNELKEQKGHGPLAIFFEQFDNFIIWVLTGAAVVSGFLREWVDALAIVVIIILNAILGFIQEYRAERSLAALRRLSSPNSKVIRDGRHRVVPSGELVPGDLIELEAGDNVPADCRVVWATANFAACEASLTGESSPVLKAAPPIAKPGLPLADRTNMAYMGTSVAAGKARAVITGTGMQTELGQIAGMLQEAAREYTPLQRRLEEFGKVIVYICFVLVGLVFAIGLLRGGKLLDMFLTAVSLAVAAIPEGLPAVVTIALALGVQKMVKRNALIRKLPSVEALGSATVICSDKTGTLTRNEMTVQAAFAANRLFRVGGIGYEPKGDILLDQKAVKAAGLPELQKALECSVLCNGSQLVIEEGVYKIVGDPTEGALLTAAAKAGIDRAGLENEYRFVQEVPFDAERKKMSIVREKGGKYYAFVKGAPDVLLRDCAYVEENGSPRPLTESDRKNILLANNSLGNEAMRVLAVASRVFDRAPQDYDAKSIEQGLTFLGLMAMIDPPREEAKEAVGKCASAGIRTVMITGDHKNTAVAIGRELGMFTEGMAAMSGEELDAVTDDELSRKIKTVSVFARVSPEHKLRIVRAIRRAGEIVAMTGDGVNDAPAVKEADIGVAMGITGTDVTKEVSDMVVTDDNFASIVAAVEEGRGIYDNIRKFIHYLLSCNTGEIMVMFTASLVGLPVPLLPIHILWVNLVTDGLPALALGVDPVAPDIMKRRPRPPGEPVITRQRGYLMLAQGASIAFCSLGAFIFVLGFGNGGIEKARTVAFIVLGCAQLFHSFNSRSMTQSLFKVGVFSNIKLVVAVVVSFLLLMAVVYVPFFQAVFKTRPLGVADWVVVLAVSSFPLWAMELVKLLNKKIKILSE